MLNERFMLLNDEWQFLKLPFESETNELKDNKNWTNVSIPHDWLIYNTLNLYESGTGWYRRIINIDNVIDFSYALEFDGVYMDSTVYVNGKEAGTWRSGYAAFSFDITHLLNNGENIVLVQVRHKSPNTRWYSGAGIYRNVRLVKTNPVHINYKGVYISTNADTGEVSASVEVTGFACSVKYTVYDNDGDAAAEAFGIPDNKTVFKVDNHILWGLDKPYLYTLKTELIQNGKVIDAVTDSFGFRFIGFAPNEGFFLNGEHMKINGVCKHHDLGALGSAMNYDALYRQVMLLKEMGANAIRSSHNMPSPELMDICDMVGILVNAESFDMWEEPKNEFDNHRFFKQTARQDVESWVKGCRNHPSLFMWSIGNEIYDTHISEHGLETARMLVSYIREFDPDFNAPETIGSNYIEWENAQKVGKMLGLSGYNYTEKCYDEHHKRYPDTIIYGSETSSAVRSRGIYHFPASIPLLLHDDHQCSSLENCYVNWGRTAEDSWIQDRNRKFCAGQFIWTGIDYIGEPTPYSTKNSYFGAIDTAGLPKDVFYFYQSVWIDFNKKPMIHLLPYWDFNIGQIIDVIAYTNAPSAELFLNGVSLGRREIDHENGDILHASWQVPYEKGELIVNAYDKNGNIAAVDSQKSFNDPSAVILTTSKNEITANGTSLAYIKISTADNNGVFVANARNRVSVEVTGAGKLIGLDNGDSTDYEQYKTTNRRLFSGKLVAIIGSLLHEGEINIKVSSIGLESAELTIKSIRPETDIKGVSITEEVIYSVPGNDIPIRKIEVDNTGGLNLNEHNKQAKLRCIIYPENATFNDITCKVVKANSTDHNIAKVVYSKGVITVNAVGDGEGFIRIYANNGSEYPQVISDVPISVKGLGEAERNPFMLLEGCSYNISDVPLNIIENGALGGFNKKCYAGFSSLNFGKSGTDALRLHVGNSAGRDIPFEIWDGVPNESGSKLIITAMYPHNGCWDRFEPYDFKLPYKLTGLHTVCAVISEKCIFGGIEFVKPDKAYAKISAADYDELYGDDYKIFGEAVEQIGNNVVISFSGMDFSEGTSRVTICGRTPNKVNSIQLRYNDNGDSKTQLLEFGHSREYTERTFDIEKISEEKDISFVFMPGSNFDFLWFKFLF